MPTEHEREMARARNARYREAHRDEINARTRVFNQTAERKAYMAQDHSARRFGGLREAVLERDGYKCTECGLPWTPSSRRVVVRHRDHDRTHNTMENLVTLCRSCHPLQHADDWTPERQHQHSESMKLVDTGKANRGKKRDPIAVEKTATANRGRKRTPEQIERYRQSKRDWWAQQAPERKSEIGKKIRAGRK